MDSALNTLVSLARYVTIVVSSGGPSSLVPPGWYVTTDSVRPGRAELR